MRADEQESTEKRRLKTGAREIFTIRRKSCRHTHQPRFEFCVKPGKDLTVSADDPLPFSRRGRNVAHSRCKLLRRLPS